MSTKPRVRFAPSPTGFLHIGGVRTALYNYLFARNKGGEFILRIEDTDVSRSEKEYTDVIMDGLKWLGLDWDEGPYFQSKRLELYKKSLQKLIENNKAYKCYCSPEVLKQKREQARKQSRPPGYDGTCRNLTKQQQKECEQKGLKYVYRIKTPEKGTITFEDKIKGKIEIDLSTIKDFILVKSDGMPTYNFACAVDDSELNITHVIRGDDHISNTPKQIIIYNALEKDVPEFAHLPQVHGTDGKRLSKRTGAVSLDEYKQKGYLPEALRNYLALLGWSTQDSQQLFEWQELIDKFDLSRCGTSPGVFDIEKLNWMNGKYIRDMDSKELVQRALPWLKKENIIKTEQEITDKIIKTIQAEKDKIKLLSDVPHLIDFMIKDNIEYNEKAVKKRLKKQGVRQILTDILITFEHTDDFTVKNLEKEIRKFCEQKQLSFGKVFHPVRVAVSGRMKGPGLFEMLEIIGKEKSIQRIKYSLKKFVE